MLDQHQVRIERLDRMHDKRDQPVIAYRRDITDTELRRSARALGFKGKYLRLSIADVLTHPQRPGDSTVLRFDKETRREAVARMRAWAWGE